MDDIIYRGLARSQPRAEIFVPVRQAATEFGFQTPFVTVRTAGDPLAVIPFLRDAVAEAHPRATIDDVMTMDARLSAAIAQPRFYAGFVGFFAALALVLAAFGIYGLLSYTVAQRRREIGVRMALGAQRGDIVGLVVRQGAALIATGAVAGLLAAAASSRVLESFLYGVTTGRPPDVRPGAARAGRRGGVRLLVAGAAGDAHRSDGRLARRVTLARRPRAGAANHEGDPWARERDSPRFVQQHLSRSHRSATDCFDPSTRTRDTPVTAAGMVSGHVVSPRAPGNSRPGAPCATSQPAGTAPCAQVSLPCSAPWHPFELDDRLSCAYRRANPAPRRCRQGQAACGVPGSKEGRMIWSAPIRTIVRTRPFRPISHA